MPCFIDPDRLAKLVADARSIDTNPGHDDFDLTTYRTAKATAPYKRGDIVPAFIGNSAPGAPLTDRVKRVLINETKIVYADRQCEYVDHYIGFVQNKDGSFGRMWRLIHRGAITRGFNVVEGREANDTGGAA